MAARPPMSSGDRASLVGMSNPPQVPTTISNIGVAMFTIADQDAAIAFYTQTLGWELRSDVAFGDEGGNRWAEVAPPRSAGPRAGGASGDGGGTRGGEAPPRAAAARLPHTPPMGGQPGGGGIGVET